MSVACLEFVLRISRYFILKHMKYSVMSPFLPKDIWQVILLDFTIESIELYIRIGSVCRLWRTLRQRLLPPNVWWIIMNIIANKQPYTLELHNLSLVNKYIRDILFRKYYLSKEYIVKKGICLCNGPRTGMRMMINHTGTQCSLCFPSKSFDRLILNS